ncbi:MAG: LCP family protein [Patescibacteria group bacterium]
MEFKKNLHKTKNKINLSSKQIKLLLITLFALLLIIIGIKFISSQLNDKRLISDNTNNQTKHLNNSTYKNDSERLKLSKDRINIIIAGIGGENHDGAYLTDSLIFASINTKTYKVSTLSIPRDLYVDLGNGYGYWKINAADALGEQENPGKGMNFTREIVEKITGQPIQYYLRLDFSGFKKIIDTLGGIGITVDRSFVDNEFPNDDNDPRNIGYKTVSFEAGYQIMDGQTALDYSRSRHGNNGEGSDFSRSLRQQKVIAAVKEKAMSLNTLMNPAKIVSLMSELNSNIQTNISYKDIPTLYKLASKLDTKNTINRTLSDSSGYVYITKTIDGASIVKPVGNNYTLIQDLVLNMFDQNYSLSKKQEVLPKIVILNGTNKAGLASRLTEQLKNTQEFKINFVGNADNRNQDTTTIYDTSETLDVKAISNLNSKIKAKIISKRLNIFNSDSEIPMTVSSDTNTLDVLKRTYTNADLILILGNDFKENL